MGIALALLAFAGGGFLLFIAAFGGGFVVKAIEVPRVGWPARAMSLFLGIVVISLGLSAGTEPRDAAVVLHSPAVREAARHPPAGEAASERHRQVDQVAAAGAE